MTSFKKLILPAAALLILIAISGVNATETRVGSMGGVGFYMHDNSNIFFFPGAIYSYSGQVVGELRSKNNDNSYSVGVHYPYGDYSVIGVYLNRPMSMTPPAGIADNVLLNHTTDVFYGTQMSQYDLGLRLSVGLDSYSDEFGGGDSTDDQSARYIALAGGISNETMDLGLQFELPSVKREILDTSYTWGGFGFGLAARMFRGETTKLVPVGVLSYTKTSAEIDRNVDPNAEVDYTDMNVGLGVGLNHELNEKNLLVMGLEVLGLSSDKTEIKDGPETTVSTLTIPGLYMGVESEIKPWLMGRLGAAQVYQSTKTKTKPTVGDETETTSRSSQFNVSFGLGFNFGDFTLDAAINEGLFFDGPNFITGGVNQMANRLSVVYKF